MKRKKLLVMGMIMVCLLSGCNTADSGAASGTEGRPEDSAPGSGEDSGASDNLSENPGEAMALSEEETQFFTEFIQENENYGFLLSDYSVPQDVNIREVFYSGAGFGAAIPKEDIPLYLEAVSEEELYTDCLKMTRQDIEAFLQRKLGIGLEAVSRPLDMVYLAETDSYYNQAGDTNYVPFSCTGGTRVGDTYTLYFTPAMDWIDWEGERETVVLKTEEGYRFLSNHILTE